MKRILAAGTAAILAAGLSGCVGYHQESAALRMVRPQADPELAAYAPPNPDYPSVGGDILKGTSPTEAAAYQATTGATEIAPPPPESKPRSP
jgi:hypothetical protein